MGKNKEKKQFQLTDKKSCIIYLYKIITSSEICIDTLKRYNIETEKTLKKYKENDLIPIEVYQDICHKTYNVQKYCELDQESLKLLRKTSEEYGYSARVIHKLLRLARTSADIDKEEKIRLQDIRKVLDCRDLDKSNSKMLVVK